MIDGKLHHGAICGLLELSDPVPVDEACPSGGAPQASRGATP
jgi:hypothetical protein